MKAVFTLILAILAMVPGVPAHANFCKWVDEAGVTHYAEECPAGVQAQSVEVTPPPSAQQVDDAARAFDQGLQVAEDGVSAQQQTGESSNPKVERNVSNARIETCVRARLDLDVLGVQRPVYFDDTGVIHHDRSYHSLVYEGSRHFVADDERPELVASLEETIASACSGSDEEQQLYEKRSAELIREALCYERQVKLVNWEGGTTGLPEPRVRELREEIEKSCN